MVQGYFMTIRFHPHLLDHYSQPRRHKITDGKNKILYAGPEPRTHVLYFKDEAVFKGEKVIVNGKGVLNNRISGLLMSRLGDLGIETHFIRILNMREQLVRAAEILPFKITLHNVASGLFAHRLGLEEGTSLSKPIPEFSLHSKDLQNPTVSAEHLTTLGWAEFEDIDDILLISQRVNDFLHGQFLALNLRLISLSLEFGRLYTPDLTGSQIVITDELSPENCYLLDLTTGKRLDCQGMEDHPDQARSIYQEVAYRLGILNLEETENATSRTHEDLFHPRPYPQQSFRKRKNPQWL